MSKSISEIQKSDSLSFVLQMPVPRNSMQLDYSRWQQNLIGVLQVDIVYHSQIEIGNSSKYIYYINCAY